MLAFGRLDAAGEIQVDRLFEQVVECDEKFVVHRASRDDEAGIGFRLVAIDVGLLVDSHGSEPMILIVHDVDAIRVLADDVA